MRFPFLGAALLFVCSALPAIAQQTTADKSTHDLSFLIGRWDITRTYRPNSDDKRVLEGRLSCEIVMDSTFINCRYEMERPAQIRSIDEVYFNYNPIYDTYESLWLSSTWPIKVLMQGTLEHNGGKHMLKTEASFEIANKIMEFVRDELVITSDGATFSRQTHIRTSEYAKGEWLHHMTETAKRIGD